MITILWRRLDLPGHEAAALMRRANGWWMGGSAVFTHAKVPARIDYEIDCDAEWHTRACVLSGWIGANRVALTLARNAQDHWFVNGAHASELDGCLDVDLGFSPATNLLPIRRLGLALGAQAPVRAAWVQFPNLSVTVLEQTYRRTARGYHYESAGGAFQRALTVSAAGFVLTYPGLWECESLDGDPEG